MEIVVGLLSLGLAFLTLCAGGLQLFLDRPAALEAMGSWAVGRSDLELKVVGALGAGAGIALLLPLVFALPTELRSAGALVVVLIMAFTFVLHLKRADILRAVITLVLANLATVIAIYSLA